VRHRTLIRANRCHDLKSVSHRHDPRTERDLISREAEGVSGAVEVLVMLLDCETPFAEPLTQGFNHSHTLNGMLMQNFPFLCRERARLVQDLGVNGDLADIVQQSGPSQSIAIGLW
jgi:hypothetical protein